MASRPCVSSPSSPASEKRRRTSARTSARSVGVGRHPIDHDEQRQTRARGRATGRSTAPDRHSASRSSRRRTGRPPRRDGRSGPDWHARASRCPVRRSGRGLARSRRRSPNEVGPVEAGRGRRRGARRGRQGGPGRPRPLSSGAGRRSSSRPRPAIVLKMVLLPAPVGPTRRTTRGASRDAARTRTCPLRWSASWRARLAAASLRGPRARRRAESASRRSTRARRSDVAVPITARG